MSGTLRRWWALALVAGLVAIALLVAVLLPSERAPVPALALSPTAAPAPVRAPLLTPLNATASIPTQRGLKAALAHALAAPALGGRVTLSVVDVQTGQPLWETAGAPQVVPASTAKILTAIAALTVLPADLRLVTRVVRGAPGDVVLVGGGDPTLLGTNSAPLLYPRPARLLDLARQLKGTVVRRVVVDDRLFTGTGTGPGWKPAYVTAGDVAPVSALQVRLSEMGSAPQDPALDAGRQLAALLHVTAVVRGHAAAGAAELASVSSPSLTELVETMLTTSDNNLAESLGREVALATHLPATFDGEVAAVNAVLKPVLSQLGLAPLSVALRDGSGLSPLDRVQPAAISRLLALAGRDDRYAAVLQGLPVAGFDGTLQDRYRKGAGLAAAGQVRAKTGTLTGVSALAGVVRTKDGRLLAFDLTADRLPDPGKDAAQAALDAVAAGLAACGCA